jgi:hypothetical protein
LLSDKAPGHGGSLDCVARVNRAIDHIVCNLAQPLRLESLAEVVGL